MSSEKAEEAPEAERTRRRNSCGDCETSHYDIVANESARAVMELVVDAALPVGNGILTVENSDQAWVRADVKQKNKGGSAAQAALDMIAVRDQLGV